MAAQTLDADANDEDAVRALYQQFMDVYSILVAAIARAVALMGFR